MLTFGTSVNVLLIDFVNSIFGFTETDISLKISCHVLPYVNSNESFTVSVKSALFIVIVFFAIVKSIYVSNATIKTLLKKITLTTNKLVLCGLKRISDEEFSKYDINDLVDFVSKEAAKAGEAAAKYIANKNITIVNEISVNATTKRGLFMYAKSCHPKVSNSFLI